MLLPLIIPDLEEWFWENKKSKKTGRMANYTVSFSGTSSRSLSIFGLIIRRNDWS